MLNPPEEIPQHRDEYLTGINGVKIREKGK